MVEVFLCLLWIFVSLFLVLIILLQRGKGGGLAGALGGVGGSSAFGTKAGDIFTRITVGVFGVWLLLAMILVWKMKPEARFVEAPGADKAAKGTAKDEPKLGGDDKEAAAKKTADLEAAEKARVERERADKEKADKEKAEKEKSAKDNAKKDLDLNKEKKPAGETKKEEPKSGAPKDGSSTAPGRSDKSPSEKPAPPPVKNDKDAGKKP